MEFNCKDVWKKKMSEGLPKLRTLDEREKQYGNEMARSKEMQNGKNSSIKTNDEQDKFQ